MSCWLKKWLNSWQLPVVGLLRTDGIMTICRYKGLHQSLIFQAWVIGLHHDNLHATTAEFPQDYLSWVATATIPEGHFLIVRRSPTYDLSDHTQRLIGSKLIIGLIRYINKKSRARIQPPSLATDTICFK